MDRGKLLRDKEQLTDKFNGFKEKYALLAKAKADVQAELVRSEEERLRVSKLLVELQIENTDIRERSEVTKASTAFDAFPIASPLNCADREV